jgi:L-histidine Nalpha-methyltransferase
MAIQRYPALQKMMVTQIQYISDAEITKAVDHGLSREHKRLPSWLLYDENGIKIFQRMTKTETFYPTRCERKILDNYKEDIFRYCAGSGKPIAVIDLGSGDGYQTELLLRHFSSQALEVRYFPVDNSTAILQTLVHRLADQLPQLSIRPVNKTYPDALNELDYLNQKLVLLLGGNIGNFTLRETADMFLRLAQFLTKNDFALIGFDLKKDPRLIDFAYDDPEGVAREFNLNILKRMNRELSGQFQINQFDHYSSYDAEHGMVKSYLVSLTDQNVPIKALGKTFHFAQWETIRMEIALKFDLLQIEKMLSTSGLEIVDLFFDSEQYFCDVLVKKALL